MLTTISSDLESLQENTKQNGDIWDLDRNHHPNTNIGFSDRIHYGVAIENNVDYFFNKVNPEDDILSRYYGLEEFTQALGEEGAHRNIPKPENYQPEENVTRDINADTNGDGKPNLMTVRGDNHSGYNGIVVFGNSGATGTLYDNGIMNNVYADWIRHDPQLENNCQVNLRTTEISYSRDDLGNDWNITLSASGDVTKLNGGSYELNHGETKSLNTTILSRDLGNLGDDISFDLMINAIETDPFNDDYAKTSKNISFSCIGGVDTFEIPVEIKEGSDTATLKLTFELTGFANRE